MKTVNKNRILKIFLIGAIGVQAFSCSSEIESPERILGQEESSSSGGNQSSSGGSQSSSSGNQITWYCDYGPRHTGGGGCEEISGPNADSEECNTTQGTISSSCATSGLFCDYGSYIYNPSSPDANADGYTGGCWPIKSNNDNNNCSRGVNATPSPWAAFVSVCPASSL